MDKWLAEISQRLTTETVERVVEHVEEWLATLDDAPDSYRDGVQDTLLAIRELLG